MQSGQGHVSSGSIFVFSRSTEAGDSGTVDLLTGSSSIGSTGSNRYEHW